MGEDGLCGPDVQRNEASATRHSRCTKWEGQSVVHNWCAHQQYHMECAVSSTVSPSLHRHREGGMLAEKRVDVPVPRYLSMLRFQSSACLPNAVLLSASEQYRRVTYSPQQLSLRAWACLHASYLRCRCCAKSRSHVWNMQTCDYATIYAKRHTTAHYRGDTFRIVWQSFWSQNCRRCLDRMSNHMKKIFNYISTDT